MSPFLRRRLCFSYNFYSSLCFFPLPTSHLRSIMETAAAAGRPDEEEEAADPRCGLRGMPHVETLSDGGRRVVILHRVREATRLLASSAAAGEVAKG